MRRGTPFNVAIALVCAIACGVFSAAEAKTPPKQPPAAAQPAEAADSIPDAVPEERRVIELGVGDQISIQVYGQPDMTATVYVGDDGTVPVALAGAVQVGGLSPSEAGKRIEDALRNGKFLVEPHVTVTVLQTRSQRVSVLGEVKTPGRFVIDSATTILDAIAQAGGTTENSATTVYLLRAKKDGGTERIPIDLLELSKGHIGDANTALRGGDSIYVPKADQFSIYGEVTTPNIYRIEPGMTVVQAISRAGGITPRGSERRVEIKRKVGDDQYKTFKAKPNDLVKPGDVIHVKESIF